MCIQGEAVEAEAGCVYAARGAHVPAAKPPELCGAAAPQACRQARGAPHPWLSGNFQFYGAICPQAVRVFVEAQERGFNSDRSQSILFGDKQTAFPTCVLPEKAGIIKKQI